MRRSVVLTRAAFLACGTAAAFLIASTSVAAQSVTFTSPTSETDWEAGSIQDITWRWSAPTADMGRETVRVLYKTTRGEWTEVGRTEAFRQTLRWRVPPDAWGAVSIRAIYAGRGIPRTFEGPTFRVTNPGRALDFARGGATPGPAKPTASDYSILRVFLDGPRELSEGVLYDADAPNYMPLSVWIGWNGVPGRYGIQCDNHQLTVFDMKGSMIFNPSRVPGMAHAAGRQARMQAPVRLPGGLVPGSDFTFRVRFRPSAAECDANAANNEATFTTRLVPMSGNDLVVRIIEVKKVPNDTLPHESDLAIVFEVMNVSGNAALRGLKVRWELRGAPLREGHRDVSYRYLEPGAWRRMDWRVPVSQIEHTWGEFWPNPTRYRLVITVDPDNEVRELRENNNTDGMWFVW